MRGEWGTAAGLMGAECGSVPAELALFLVAVSRIFGAEPGSLRLVGV
jgi:hypothetical protein